QATLKTPKQSGRRNADIGRIQMARIVITEFVSLDGVMQARGGQEDFTYAGWTFEISRGEDGDKFKTDEAREAEALLLGRVTYEGFARAWPTRTGEFADKFNNMPTYVVSSTLKNPQWKNTTVFRADVVGEGSMLGQARGGERVVNGGRQRAETLVHRVLVDDLRSRRISLV